MDNKKAFNYTYSAKEQEEIKKIREKYEEKEKSEEISSPFSYYLQIIPKKNSWELLL